MLYCRVSRVVKAVTGSFDPVAAGQRRMLDVPDRVELEDQVAQLSIEGPDKLKSDAEAAAPLEGATRRGETKSKTRRVRVCNRSCISRHSHRRCSAPRPLP
jgi:hypothetical protein